MRSASSLIPGQDTRTGFRQALTQLLPRLRLGPPSLAAICWPTAIHLPRCGRQAAPKYLDGATNITTQLNRRSTAPPQARLHAPCYLASGGSKYWLAWHSAQAFNPSGVWAQKAGGGYQPQGTHSRTSLTAAARAWAHPQVTVTWKHTTVQLVHYSSLLHIYIVDIGRHKARTSRWCYATNKSTHRAW